MSLLSLGLSCNKTEHTMCKEMEKCLFDVTCTFKRSGRQHIFLFQHSRTQLFKYSTEEPKPFVLEDETQTSVFAKTQQISAKQQQILLPRDICNPQMAEGTLSLQLVVQIIRWEIYACAKLESFLNWSHSRACFEDMARC